MKNEKPGFKNEITAAGLNCTFEAFLKLLAAKHSLLGIALNCFDSGMPVPMCSSISILTSLSSMLFFASSFNCCKLVIWFLNDA